MILLHVITAICYAVALRRSIFFWLAAGLHIIGIGIHQWQALRFDVGMSLSLFMLITALVAWRRIRPASRAVLLVLMALSSLAPMLFYTPKAPSLAPVTVAHVLLAMLAYAFAATTMLQWLDLRLAERARRQLSSAGTVPLLTMEKNCFCTLAQAFALLSLTLVSGVAFGDGFPPAHKTLFAVLTWVTFGGLLVGRHYLGWRGRTAQIWLATGFMFFVLSYFGTYFVLQVLLEKS
ncbi:cytochrome c biogenesis protein CcsA [Candidatus Persebacteraceae bacterium Df01]|jgi:ABC-type uncharacterized transport system permease subunit|uniref:Cytochrome c biogenesis protein CcsA n=1 Tax=Candidatus Doriopsillibacter californiensis TaxID=2970740 RepID=A0ABT7QL23_9GAMM|nr:cytochrome c biogenesis protein CcsA [Candidatus Persebacteraceae bacterium Df01]